MQRFQGLHVVSKDPKPTSNSTGLEPYLALKPRPKSKPYAKSLDWVIWGLCGVLVLAYCSIVAWAITR